MAFLGVFKKTGKPNKSIKSKKTEKTEPRKKTD
jgi:hypothetical protein